MLGASTVRRQPSTSPRLRIPPVHAQAPPVDPRRLAGCPVLPWPHNAERDREGNCGAGGWCGLWRSDRDGAVLAMDRGFWARGRAAVPCWRRYPVGRFVQKEQRNSPQPTPLTGEERNGMDVPPPACACGGGNTPSFGSLRVPRPNGLHPWRGRGRRTSTGDMRAATVYPIGRARDPHSHHCMTTAVPCSRPPTRPPARPPASPDRPVDCRPEVLDAARAP